MKYRLYVDEVGNPDLNSSADENHRFLCLTGVIFELNYVSEVLSPELESLKVKYFGSHPDDPIILHRKEILYKKPPFAVLSNPETERKFNMELLMKLKQWKYSVITVIIDKREHAEKYSTWRYDPYHYCQEVLIERFRLFLNIKKSKGDVMYESRGGKEDMRLKRSFRNIMESGTHNINSEDLQLHLTSLELKVKSKQSNIAGLQVADLIAHPARRWCFKNFFDRYDLKSTFGDKVIEILEKEKFFRYNGEIRSYGAKKLP
ncbi:MAG: DUF3800 domain-containing protein [Lentimicrobium sp.]|nr:DUF3800 domain-containing protein [Lentimicrobium sp.]